MKRRVQNRKWKQRFIVRAASVSLWMCMAVVVPVQAEGETEDAVIQYEQNASVLSASARQYRKGLESLNSASSQLSRDQAVWAQVKSAQILFGTCRQLEAQAAAAEKSAEASEAAFEKKKSEKAAGLCTELEVLQAEKTAASAGISAQSMRDQADAALRKLAIFLGKEAEEIEIGKMPVIEAKQLEALSLLTDRETAVIALCEAYEEYQWAMRGV